MPDEMSEEDSSVIKILLSEPNGSLTVMTVERDLHTFQKLVGGFIEGVRLLNGAYAYVNEEGLLKGLEHNPVASILTKQVIVGPMVIMGTPRGSIETSVSDKLVKGLATLGFVITEEE